MTKQYHVGIDFGTSQTKICVSNLGQLTDGSRKYFFHKFSQAQTNPYFLPSTLKLTEDGFCQFGIRESNPLRYFKMKALFNDEQRFNIAANEKINQDVLAKYPEICCILYLAYCIIDLKQSLSLQNEYLKEEKGEQTTKTVTSNISRLIGKIRWKNSEKKQDATLTAESAQEEHKYQFTIGIPTEHDKNEFNYYRRSKQYEMLYLAVQLSKDFKSVSLFTQVKIIHLLSRIEYYFKGIESIENGTRVPNRFYQETQGLFVIAETTAGIEPARSELKTELTNIVEKNNNFEQPLYNFKRRNQGNYMTMDVGAGTTDVSFFRFNVWVREDTKVSEIKVRYYASKSIEAACNTLYYNYLFRNPNDPCVDLNYNDERIEAISQFDFNKINIVHWQSSQQNFRNYLFRQIRQPDLFGRVNQIYNGALRCNWHRSYIIAKGCKVYGGGCRFNEFSSGVMTLHNGGVRVSGLETETELGRWFTGVETPIIRSLVSKEGIPLTYTEKTEITESFDLLNVALGLAMLDHHNRPDSWIERDDNDNPLLGLNGPNNYDDGGMAKYNVFNRDWLKK